MNRSLPVVMIVALFATSLVAVTDVHAGGGSGWGWAKPMNKRMGAFYTSNRNANFSRSNKRSTHSYPRSQPAYTTSPRYHVPQSGASHQIVPSNVAPAPPLHHAVVQPRVVAGGKSVPQPSTRFGISPATSIPPVTKPVSVPPTDRPSDVKVLPHKSTATTFWQ